VADDPSIPDNSRLFRRIPADANHIIWDDTTRAYTLSTQSFRNLQKIPPAFSVNLECVLDQLGLAPIAVIADSERYGLVALPVQLVRQHNQAVERHPEQNDPSHGHVVGDKPKSIAREFIRAVTPGNAIQWIIPPPGWPWPPKQ
jgi:hypothetical protein